MADSDSHWYAVTTKSRHEKVVAEQLWQKDIECFLPLREVLSKWKDRYKKVQFPLFPGYLFIHRPDTEAATGHSESPLDRSHRRLQW